MAWRYRHGLATLAVQVVNHHPVPRDIDALRANTVAQQHGIDPAKSIVAPGLKRQQMHDRQAMPHLRRLPGQRGLPLLETITPFPGKDPLCAFNRRPRP
jgi:hypothetical protein